MKIVDFNKPQLDILERSLSPAHFLGFLTAGMMLAVADKPYFDREMLNRLGYEHGEFVARQKRNGDPTGLPVAPLYWTDLHPEPQEDEADAIAIEPPGCAFLLCSSLEPHARWVVKHDIEDNTITVYKTQIEAEEAIEARRIEYQEEFAKAVEEVKQRYREGDVDGAERMREDFDFDGFLTTDDPGHVTIEGERIKIGGGDHVEYETKDDKLTRVQVSDTPPGLAVETVEPIDAPTVTADVIPAGSKLSRGAAIESVKAHLLAGDQQGAAKIAVAHSIPLSVRSDGSYAHVDHVRLDIPRIVPRPSPEPEAVKIVAVDLCGNTGVTLRLSDGTTKSYKLADGPAGVKSVWIDDKQVVSEGRELKAAIIDRIKARLRAGECGMAENMARHAGIGFEWTPVPFEASIDGQTFNFSGTPHGL